MDFPFFSCYSYSQSVKLHTFLNNLFVSFCLLSVESSENKSNRLLSLPSMRIIDQEQDEPHQGGNRYLRQAYCYFLVDAITAGQKADQLSDNAFKIDGI